MNHRDIAQFKIQSVPGIAADLRSNKTFIYGVGLIIVLYVFLSAVAFSWLEGKSYFDSLYFTVINITTVGFGDIVPALGLGKALAMLNAVVGLVLFGFFVAAFTAALQSSEFNGSVEVPVSNGSDERESNDGVNDFFRALSKLVRQEDSQDAREGTHSTSARVVMRVNQGVVGTEVKHARIWIDIDVH